MSLSLQSALCSSECQRTCFHFSLFYCPKYNNLLDDSCSHKSSQISPWPQRCFYASGGFGQENIAVNELQEKQSQKLDENRLCFNSHRMLRDSWGSGRKWGRPTFPCPWDLVRSWKGRIPSFPHLRILHEPQLMSKYHFPPPFQWVWNSTNLAFFKSPTDFNGRDLRVPCTPHWNKWDVEVLRFGLIMLHASIMNGNCFYSH